MDLSLIVSDEEILREAALPQRILPGTAQQFPSGDRKVLGKKSL